MSTEAAPQPADPRLRLLQLPTLKHWLLWSLLGVAITLAFGFAAKSIPGVLPTELSWDEALTDIQFGVLNAFSIGLSMALSPPGAIALLIISFVYLLVARHSPVNALAFTGLTTCAWLLSGAFKLIVAEPRPNAALLDHPLLPERGDNSYPSGHTTFTAGYAMACYLLARGTRWERPVAIGGCIAVVVMGAVRLYVSAHYLTDVLGALLTVLTATVFYSGVWNRYGLSLLRRLTVLRRFGPIP